MRRAVLVLALVLLAPGLAQAAAPSPTDGFGSLDRALRAGDLPAARAAYADAFHPAFAASDASLDANLTAALAAEDAAAHVEAIEMGVLAGARAAMRDALLHQESRAAAAPWHDLLAARLDLAGSEMIWTEMGADADEVREHRDQMDELVLRAFARETQARIAAATVAGSLAQAEAAQAAFAPVAPALIAVVGAPYAHQAEDEMAAFVEALATGDTDEVHAAGEVATSILGEFIAPPTTTAERLAKVVASAKLVLTEYEEYVHDGKIVDQEAYDEELLGVFLPTLEARWAAVSAQVPEHQRAEVDEAVEAIGAKVHALAPAAEVDAEVEAIEHEIEEVTGVAAAPVGTFAAAQAELHEAVESALDKAKAGDKAGAIAALKDAYVDVYGPKLEGRVLAVSSDLNREIEDVLNVDLRAAVERGAPAAELDALAATLDAKVEEARVAAEGTQSDGALFFNSFLIMLREGFEAILVIGALATYLIRTGHKARTPLLYAGAAAGVVATFALYLAVRLLVDALPVNREILEGITALLAVVVLFYVSYWLISKIEVGKWNRFIQGKMKGALATGNGYALAGVAFLAVFREGFETVLFYQGLYTGTGHGVAISLGVLVGAAALALIFVGFYRFGVKIPMRPFFVVTSVLLYYLAIAFAGKGVHELQEAGVLATTSLPAFGDFLALPVVSTFAELLGVYPTVETLVAQAVLVVAIAGGLAWTFVIEPRRSEADAAVEV